MFLKKRLINGKFYYSLAHSYRENGKIKQRIIESLGDSKKAYEILQERPEFSHFLPKIQNEIIPVKYHTIYADPPWFEAGAGKIQRGANKHYPLMKTSEIAKLPIANIADKNCHLYLWVTNNFLKDGLFVLESWGFRYITKITWVKGTFEDKNTVKLANLGLGQYFRGQDEICLFGISGRLPYKEKDGKREQGNTVLVAPRGKHSEKPKAMYSIIEKISYPPFVELFARKKRRNWDRWGNEVFSSFDF